MKLNSFFSRYLKAADFHEAQVVTIDLVQLESIGHGEDEQEKPVIYFKELEKGAVLGPTTTRLLTELLGTDETDGWVGKRVEIFNDTTVRFRGSVGGIRYRSASPSADEFPG